MTLKEVFEYLRDDLKDYLDDIPSLRSTVVECYRIESTKMENWNRTGPRIAIYDGGDNVSASIPGADQLRGDRVSYGYPERKVQVFRIDLAWFIAERTQGDWNELELVELLEAVRTWIDGMGLKCLNATDGKMYGFMYGSSNGITRITKYAYTTVTCYGIIQKT